MAWYFYVLLIGAGFLCGAINTLAGSGSLITLPVLIFLGLPPTVANGTNRIGILLQNISGSLTYSRRQVLDLRGALLLSAPALLGSLLGASIAVNLNEELMQRVIAGVMVVMLFVIWLKPQRWLEGTLINLQGAFNWQQGLALFAIGVYGGFIQAGVGIFLLATLVLSVGYDLVRANAVKVFHCAGIYCFFPVDFCQQQPGGLDGGPFAGPGKHAGSLAGSPGGRKAWHSLGSLGSDGYSGSGRLISLWGF